MLSLLSEAAEDRPLLCLIDDAQWLDRSSGQVLAFVARRLQAESVALVFAVRESVEPDELARLPELRLHGLSDRHARELLASVIGAPLDEGVRARILAEARGNPLALLELPGGLSPAELGGGFGLPAELPLQTRIEASFRRRVEQLPDATQRLLLLAAAEPTGEVALLWRSAAALGLSVDALDAAVGAGLLELSGRVTFRHPLLRSAIYQEASTEDRRAAHRALADATDADADPDRRAWHRAQAALGPDDDVADELERSAGRAKARGGVAAAAALLQRAVALTLDPGARARRAVEAAAAKQLAGAPEEALSLLSVAVAGPPLGELDEAMVQRLRGQIALDLRRAGDAVPLLLDAAGRLEALDPGLARRDLPRGDTGSKRRRPPGRRHGGRGEGRARRAAPPGRSERRRSAARRARDPLHRRLRRQRERAQAGVGRRARRGWPGRSGRPLAMDRPAGRSGPVRRRHVARARPASASRWRAIRARWRCSRSRSTCSRWCGASRASWPPPPRCSTRLTRSRTRPARRRSSSAGSCTPGAVGTRRTACR